MSSTTPVSTIPAENGFWGKGFHTRPSTALKTSPAGWFCFPLQFLMCSAFPWIHSLLMKSQREEFFSNINGPWNGPQLMQRMSMKCLLFVMYFGAGATEEVTQSHWLSGAWSLLRMGKADCLQNCRCRAGDGGVGAVMQNITTSGDRAWWGPALLRNWTWGQRREGWDEGLSVYRRSRKCGKVQRLEWAWCTERMAKSCGCRSKGQREKAEA